MERIFVGICSALAGAALTYGLKAVSIEGRLDGIERAVIRIEHKLQ